MKTQEDISVCLVDDDKMFVKTLEHQLREKFKPNVSIRSFGTAEECLVHLENKPVIVILDYYLNSKFPDAMNGIQALLKIKEIDPEALVIVVSGQNKMNVAVDTLKHGAFDYIVKNESTYTRIQNSIRHAISSILLSKQLRLRKIRVAAGLAVVSILLLGICLFVVFSR